jgi:ethanolamine ammonia-lyase small subunit
MTRELANQDPQDDWRRAVASRTPARVFVERSGLAYRTSTWLELRHDHAAAIDAVRAEVRLDRDFAAEFVASRSLFSVQTRASSKQEFLLRPDLGRQFSDPARQELASRCPRGADLQIVIGDGLSAAAVITQTPVLLPLLEQLGAGRGWRLGQPFLVTHCRVGILNDLGDLLSPRVVVLLIGERPGLATAESLSAYMAYQPSAGHTDAQRNLISNIHARGVPPAAAAERIANLAQQLMTSRSSGVSVKETIYCGLGTRQTESKPVL